ncbi:MAG: Mrp/NBP35 family ATP-binding protein [Elusimicrobia bacterium]|nr:Mrp/NBP35 family ATP-binding protein [Candidatus Obscuribacterium magneticum]
MPTLDEIKSALSTVEEPELHRDLVSLNMVKGITNDNGNVSIVLELTTPACPLRDELTRRIEEAVKKRPGVKKVQVEFTARVIPARPVTGKMAIEGVKHVVAVYACKGGVGKSTISTNLAVSLVQRGSRVGLLDADIYGPDIPLMMGIRERPQASAHNKMAPPVAHGVKLMSLGFLTDANTPMIWRGPMVHGAVQQLLRETDWGDLDYLIVDLPPGTGDAQLTLVQSVPLSGVVVVSTPQVVSLADGVKGIEMFRKLQVPILGLIENMSGFKCPECGHLTPIFSQGGAEAEARRLGIPFLGSLPIEPEVVTGGDAGQPIVVFRPDSSIARLLLQMSERVAANISIAQFEIGQSPHPDESREPGPRHSGGSRNPG